MYNWDAYWIENLLWFKIKDINYGCACVENTLNTNTNKTMGTKELNFIEKIKLEKFAVSKEAEQLGELTIEAEKEITVIWQVINRLTNLANVVSDSVYYINQAVERQDIVAITSLSNELTEMVKQLKDSNFADPINELTEVFGIEAIGTLTADSKTISKALGFKVKEKVGKVKA